MEFRNIVKGQLTQSLLKTLMERAGYRVTRLGVEELFGEIKYLDLKQYLDLKLPLSLRYLPDLLVAEPDMQKAYLVEVKFRREFNEQAITSLFNDLKKQREHWQDSYAVVMIAMPFVQGGRFNQDVIRVLTPSMTDRLDRNHETYSRFTCEQVWNSLMMLHNVFPQFERTNDGFANADLITSTIKDLSKL